MREIKFEVPKNQNTIRIEGLGVIRYQIFELPSLGQNSIDQQIDYQVTTEVGSNITDSQMLAGPNYSFGFEYNDIS